MPKVKAVRKPKRLFTTWVMDEKDLKNEVMPGETIYEVVVKSKFKAKFSKPANPDDSFDYGEMATIPEAK